MLPLTDVIREPTSYWVSDSRSRFISGIWLSRTHAQTHSYQNLEPVSTCIGEGNGTPLQYSCLENPMDGGAWWAAVHEVAELDTTQVT